MEYSPTHPSKVLRHCPRCGSPHFTCTDGKRFFCQDCQKPHYVNTAAAVAAIILDPQGRILLARRQFEPRKGFLDLPGGFLDPMETAEAAVAREVQEELGVEVQRLEYLCSFPNEYPYQGLSYFTLDLAFVCHVPDLSGLQAQDDVAEVVLCRPEDIPFEEISFPSIEKILRRFCAQQVTL